MKRLSGDQMWSVFCEKTPVVSSPLVYIRGILSTTNDMFRNIDEKVEQIYSTMQQAFENQYIGYNVQGQYTTELFRSPAFQKAMSCSEDPRILAQQYLEEICVLNSENERLGEVIVRDVYGTPDYDFLVSEERDRITKCSTQDQLQEKIARATTFMNKYVFNGGFETHRVKPGFEKRCKDIERFLTRVQEYQDAVQELEPEKQNVEFEHYEVQIALPLTLRDSFATIQALPKIWDQLELIRGAYGVPGGLSVFIYSASHPLGFTHEGGDVLRELGLDALPKKSLLWPDGRITDQYAPHKLPTLVPS